MILDLITDERANLIYRGIYGADYQPSELLVDQIIYILYAFADIRPDGEVYMY